MINPKKRRYTPSPEVVALFEEEYRNYGKQGGDTTTESVRQLSNKQTIANQNTPKKAKARKAAREATNMRDLGKDMGITLHTPYPGYEEALRQLNEARETSHKGGIVDILRLDKEHMPYIWRALLGLHYGLVPGLVAAGTAYGISNLGNNRLIQTQKVGGKILPPWY